jgi:hypothetical protein
VLEAQKHGKNKRHLVMQAEEGARAVGDTAAAEEGDVGTEKGGIVVGPDEAIAGGERMDETLLEGLLGRSPGENDVVIIHCFEEKCVKTVEIQIRSLRVVRGEW